jgi:hypothetical protein
MLALFLSLSIMDTRSVPCVFRTIVTARFGRVTADFGIVTDEFGDVTGRH